MAEMGKVRKIKQYPHLTSTDANATALLGYGKQHSMMQHIILS